jgi:putative SOS response-associated peptidase YedK
MCARYTLTKKEKDLAKALEVIIPVDYAPNFNLAPTQNGLVITADEPGVAQHMHFGLVPYWAENTKLNISTLNARSEEAMSKKTWKPLIEKHKTCLVIADSFYEWDRKTGKSIPWRFVLKDRDIFSFAGLWSQWKSKDGSLVYRSFSIMTTKANTIVGKIHDPKDRMPVILDKHDEKLWLSKDISTADLLSLCDTYPDEAMDYYRVSTDVNTAAIKTVPNNRPELIMALNSL